MASDGKVVISTALDNSGLKGQYASLGKMAKKIGGVIAAAFSVRAVANFAKECLELGSDLQEVQNVVDVTFSTMNKKVNEFAKNAAVTAGLSETMAKRYSGTFGAMAKSFQFTEAEAFDMATSLTQLSGDVASFYNLSQDEAYTKLKSVFTGETESLKDLGVVMTQTALDSYAMAKGFGKTTSQMTEQEKVALRYQFVMDQLSGASGDFVRTSDSWANQTKVLSLQFEQLKATLGQGLINVLTPAVQMLNTLISRVQVLADSFKAATESLFGDAGPAESASQSYDKAAENAGDLAENIEKADKAAKKSLAGFDEITKLSGNSGGSENVIGGLIPEKEAAKTESGAKKVEAAGKRFGALSVFLDMVTEALKALSELIDGVKPSLKWLWDKVLVPMAKYAGQAFVDFLLLLTEAFRGLSEWASNNKDTVNSIFQVFLGFLAGIWVYNTTKKVVDFLSALGTGFIKLGTILASDGVAGVTSKFGSLMEKAGLKGAFFAASIGILVAGIVALAANWDKMKPAERVITILGALAAAATAAAVAIAVFHTSWSVGLAAAAIAGGLTLLGLSFAFSDNGTTADAAESAANNFYSSYDWNKNFALPALANGAVLPANKPFLAVVGDQRHGTNVEAPLATIQEAVALVMSDMMASNMAGHEATVAVLKEILEAVLGIEIGDDVIGRATARYNAKMSVVRGGAR